MIKFFLVALVMGLMQASHALGEKISLAQDGAEYATIEYDKVAKMYALEILYLSIRTLDPVTNREMTLLLGECYAQEILSQHLKRDLHINFEACAHKIDDTKEPGKVKCTYAIPETAIVVHSTCEKNSEQHVVSAEKDVAQDEKHDILLLERSHSYRELRAYQRFFMAAIRESKLDDLEMMLEQVFTHIEQRIHADDALFMAEKKGLSEKADRLKRTLIIELQNIKNKKKHDQ